MKKFRYFTVCAWIIIVSLSLIAVKSGGILVQPEGVVQWEENNIQLLEVSPLLVPAYSQESFSVSHNDLGFDKQQQALAQAQILKIWEVTSGSKDIVIAVLDTGIDQEHEALVGKVVKSVNFTSSSTTNDIYGHGTHVAGIIAANGKGVIGIAHSCLLMNVKVIGDDGVCYPENVAKGIRWAVDHGANVIVMSLAVTEPSQDLEEAVDYAWEKGAIMVSAAGNYPGQKLACPACYQNCQAVDFGVEAYSTMPGNKYGYKEGASVATAYVSALAALLYGIVVDSNANGFVNDEVRDIIESSCDNVGKDTDKKTIDAFRAVSQVSSYCTVIDRQKD